MDESTTLVITLVLGFAAPIIAILTENSGKQIGRLGFLGRFVLVGIVNVAVAGIFSPAPGSIEAANGTPLIIILTIVVTTFFFVRAMVQRARHAGVSKNYCYLYFIPIANLFLFLYLLFKSGAESSASTAENSLG